jgi:hypothetical protein
MAVKYTNIFQYRALQIYPYLDFWYEIIPFGKPWLRVLKRGKVELGDKRGEREKERERKRKRERERERERERGSERDFCSRAQAAVVW